VEAGVRREKQRHLGEGLARSKLYFGTKGLGAL